MSDLINSIGASIGEKTNDYMYKVGFSAAMNGEPKNLLHPCLSYNQGYEDGLKQRQINAISSIANK